MTAAPVSPRMNNNCIVRYVGKERGRAHGEYIKNDMIVYGIVMTYIKSNPNNLYLS